MLSRNATFNSHGQDSSYFLGWQEYEKNPYHEVHNTNGIIQMGLAENQLCFDLLESWLAKNPEAAAFKKNGESIFAELALFQDYHGLPAFKKAMVDFMAEIRGNKVTFDPNHLVLTAGATSANETLIFCLADPGEAVLIPTPYYPGSRNLWLPIKHGARVSQKDKLGLTFFFAILLPGWIPVVNAVDENAFLRGTISPCTWFWIIIITIASAYCAYKILRRSPPEPYLFSEKVRIWINGEMNVEVYDDEGILVGSWRCALSTANGEWVTHLLNCVLHIFVQQEDGVEEITFNQMDDPKFIGMPKDVYLHNPNTGLLRYIGRSVPQNGAPSERDILRVRTMLM